MNKQHQKRFTNKVIFIKVMFIMVGMLFVTAMTNACSQPPAWNGLDVSGALPDLDFTLTNSDGDSVNAESFRGKTTLLYFGFTNCPVVCPTTLGQISVALAELGELAADVQVLLVSVDPERDTPQVMKDYTARFGPWLHGLTGSESALRTLNQSYKVDFMAQGTDPDGQYDVVHSNRIFAFDSGGACRLLLADISDTAAIVSDLQRLVEE